MRVRLNLSTKPLVTHRRFLVAAGAAAAVAALAFLILGWNVYSNRKESQAVLARMAQLRSESQNLDARRAKLEGIFGQPENEKLADRAAYLNKIIDESSFLWTQMFMDLEQVKPSGVRLLSISPKMEKGIMQVHLKVGAQSDEAKLKFLRSLESSKAFEKVRLLNDQQGQGQGADPQVFEVTVVYTRA